MESVRRASFFYAALSSVVLVGLYFSSLYNYLLFHTLAEMFSIVVAFGIFVIGWNSKDYIKNNYLLFLAIAYLFIAFLDLLHTMAYKGMGIFTDYDYYANQLWIATRYLESLSLLVAFCFIRPKMKFHPNAIFTVYLLTTGLIVSSIFYWDIFPVCFIDGQGLTPFKKISEYIISLILLVDIFLLVRMRSYFDPQVHRWLVGSLIFTILSELAFTFYISNYGFSNLVGHYFKVFSFYLVYKALVETGITKPHAVMFRALQDSESKYRALVESSSDFIWEIDREGRYTYASPLSSDILGYGPDEMIGRASFEFMAPVSSERSRTIFEDAIATKASLVNLEGIFIHKDGHEVTLESNGMPIVDDSGEVVGFRGVDRDISDRKALEKLQERVSQIMRHDLKSPLNGILGLPQIMKADGGLNHDQLKMLNMIEGIGHRMLRMIDSQLDLFKMETGTFIYIPQPVDLVSVIEEIINDLNKLSSAKQVPITLLVNGGLTVEPCLVQSNEDLLFSMLSNLLTNAVEASPEHETVVVRVDEGAETMVEISNRGAVPYEVRERFFQKFKTFGKERGTGLGTYSAKLIADAMGYDIDLKISDEVNTTSVFITMPSVG